MSGSDAGGSGLFNKDEEHAQLCMQNMSVICASCLHT
jgi:hypothetical protein